MGNLYALGPHGTLQNIDIGGLRTCMLHNVMCTHTHTYTQLASRPAKYNYYLPFIGTSSRIDHIKSGAGTPSLSMQDKVISVSLTRTCLSLGEMLGLGCSVEGREGEGERGGERERGEEKEGGRVGKKRGGGKEWRRKGGREREWEEGVAINTSRCRQ